MYWKKLLGITTVSCRVGSIRVRPEWPWRARRYKIILEQSVQYWYLFLFLLPCFSSTCRQTNEDNTGNVSEDYLLFSRILLLHHLLDVLVFHDAEDWSIFFDTGQSESQNSLVQHRSKFYSLLEKSLRMSWQNLVFVFLLWPLIGFQNHLHSIATHSLPARCRRGPCCSSPWPTYSSHEKFWTTSENCLCS